MRLTPLHRDAGRLPGSLRLAGHITGDGIPADEILWVDVPEAYADETTDRLDAWLLWLLPHAFMAGEDLVLDGPVDADLLRNSHELMEVWATWHPAGRPVRLTAEATGADRPNGIRTGLFFTAGVDSFYSLMLHDELTRLHPEWRGRPVDDLIYVEGYDIPLCNRAELDRKRAALAAVADETGKTLVTLVTNYRDTSISLRNAWGPMSHGPALVAAAHVVGRRWHRLLVSASFGYDELNPWGSSLVTDPLLSTSATRVEHYGACAGSDRLRKLEFLSRFDVALQHLHVCWKDGSDRNCGVCEKCFRTLLALDLVGARDRATSFPSGDFDVATLREVWSDHDLVVRVYERIRRHALACKRSDVVAIIDECLARPRPAQPTRPPIRVKEAVIDGHRAAKGRG